MKTRISRFKTCLIVVLLLLGIMVSGAFGVNSPKETIKESADRTLAILNDASLSESAKKELLRKTILPHLDFDQIARRVLARHFEANKSRMGEFIPLFTEFLESVYVNLVVMESAKGASIVVLGESIDEEYATVRSKVVTAKGKEIPVDYRLYFNGSEWKVYDIFVEGTSMVSSYRTQFGRIIQKSSFDGLLQALRKRIQELKNK